MIVSVYQYIPVHFRFMTKPNTFLVNFNKISLKNVGATANQRRGEMTQPRRLRGHKAVASYCVASTDRPGVVATSGEVPPPSLSLCFLFTHFALARICSLSIRTNFNGINQLLFFVLEFHCFNHIIAAN